MIPFLITVLASLIAVVFVLNMNVKAQAKGLKELRSEFNTTRDINRSFRERFEHVVAPTSSPLRITTLVSHEDLRDLYTRLKALTTALGYEWVTEDKTLPKMVKVEKKKGV